MVSCCLSGVFARDKSERHPYPSPARWRGGLDCFSGFSCMTANHQLAGSATALLCVDSSWTETRRRNHDASQHPWRQSIKSSDRSTSAWIGARAESRRDFSNMSAFQINRSLLEKKSLSDRHQSLERSTGSPTIPALAASSVSWNR